MIKLLLVEDERITREYIKYVIQENHLDIEVHESCNGKKAIDRARELKPELIIMDIRMPEMDGLQAGKRIKQEMPWIKIVILTAYDQFEYAQNAVKSHLDDYLLKPVSPEALIQSINQHISENTRYDIENNRFDDIIKLERNLVESLIQRDEEMAIQSIDSIFDGYRRVSYSIDDLKKYTIELIGVATRRLSSVYMTNRDVASLKRDFQDNVMSRQALEDIAQDMKDYTINLITTIKGSQRNPKDQNIQKALRYLSYHYDEKLYLRDVAEYIGYSESYFSRLFREVTGQRFSDYLNAYRIGRAKKLMDNYQLTLGEIAIKVGFEDFSYFSQVFNRYEDMTPSHYRKNHRMTE